MDKQHEQNNRHKQPGVTLSNLGVFSVREIMKNAALFEPLKDEELHAKVLWSRIDQLAGADALHLPRIIGQIDLLNVEHPERIGKSHSSQVVSQLRTQLNNKRFSYWYSEYPKEVYEAIITDLETGGGLSKYINGLEKDRNALGIATPIPLIDTMARIKKAIGRGNAGWSIDMVKEMSSILGKNSSAQIDGLYPADYVCTVTGFGRNPSFDAVRQFIEPDGTYVEVGSSLGIYAADVKKALGFKRLVASDIMSEKQAGEITHVNDFQKGGKVPYTPEQREKVEEDIDVRLWGHNIMKEKIAPHVPDRQGFFCFGFHNVLAHLVDRDTAVQNATHGLAKPGDVVWASGGYSANIPILRNLVYKMTGKGAKTYLINKNETTPLDSLEAVTDKVREGRNQTQVS